jgi:hypothetical protein
VLVTMALGVSWASTAAQELVPNGGMEGEYVDGVAPGWASNCYGEFVVSFAKETANPRSGQAAQKIECTSFKQGGVQIRCSGIKVVKGQTYTLQAWMRGEGIKGPVLLCVRQHPAPYTRYLAQYVRVSEEWRRFTVIGEASDSDENCGIYVWFGSTGSLWIDDVSLRPGAHKPQEPGIAAAPVKGNRVYNSSFELGGNGWWGGTVVAGGYDSPHAIRLSGNESLESRPFGITPGQLYTISLCAKSEEADAKLSVEVVEYADAGGDQPVARHNEREEFSVTNQWQRYHFSALLEGPFTSGYMLRLRAERPLRIDAVQVEEGGLSEYHPVAPVEVAMEMPVLARYPLPRQPVEPLVRVWAPGRSNEQIRIKLATWDFFGERKPCGDATIVLDEHGRGEAKVRCQGRDFGIYRLRAQADGRCAEGEVVIGVLPSDDGKRAPQSFFGTHANMNPQTENVGVVLARRAGMRWYRLHDFNHHTQWFHCEPERKGEFSWADEEIEDLYRRGFEIVGTLVRTPKWAGREYPPEQSVRVPARVPRELSWFADYVRVVVNRYKEMIKYWEIWNEPYHWGFWAGTAEEYVELERLGFQAAHEADAGCRVLGMCIYPGVKQWIASAVAAGSIKHLDVLSYHVYISPDMTKLSDETGYSMLEEQVRYLHSLLQGEGRPEVPIWNSEGGIGCPSFYSWLPKDGYSWGWAEAAAAVPKAVAQMMSQRVEKWFYYFIGYANGTWGPFYRMNNIAYVETDVDGSPKATLLAHAAAARFLDERSFIGRIVGPHVVAYVFQGKGQATALTWARAGENENSEVELAVPGECTVYDLMGRQMQVGNRLRLTDCPVYLVAKTSGQQLRTFLRKSVENVSRG